MEALYIRHYDSVDNGLNHLYIPGVNNGFKGKKHSVENVLKIKKRMKGFTPVKAIDKNKKSLTKVKLFFVARRGIEPLFEE